MHPKCVELRCALFIIFSLGFFRAWGTDGDQGDAAGEGAVAATNYDQHIKPIFRQHCLKCHGDDQQEAGINLQNYGALLRGGSGGVIVVAGRPSQSLLFQAMTHEDANARMPPESPPLSVMEIDQVRKWIDDGLRETSSSESLAASRPIAFVPATGAIRKPTGPPAMPAALAPVELPTLLRPLPVLAVAASPWAPLVAASGQEHLRLIDTQSGVELGKLPFPEGEPHVIRFSRNGEILMVAGGRPVQIGKVVLFDVRTGQRLAEIGDEIDAVLAADLSPDQTMVALGGTGRVVKIYSTSDGELKTKLTKHTDWITAAAFSPDGTVLATGDRAGAIHLWDVVSGGIRLNLSEHQGAITSLDWREDGKWIVSASEDGKILWWDAADGFPAISRNQAHPPERPAGVYGKIPSGVLSARFGPSGFLVTTGRDRKVRLWNAQGEEVQCFEAGPALPISAAISFDGSMIFAGDTVGEVQSWSSIK